MDTGIIEFFRDKRGFYLSGFGNLDPSEMQRIIQTHREYRLVWLSNQERIRELFGEAALEQ